MKTFKIRECHCPEPIGFRPKGWFFYVCYHCGGLVSWKK